MTIENNVGDIMAKFLVTGEVRIGASTRQFEKQVEAESEKLAKENAYALFGSNAGIKRSAVKIKAVEKL